MSEPEGVFCKKVDEIVDAEVVRDEVLAFNDMNGLPYGVGSVEIGVLPDAVVRRLFGVASAVAEKPGVAESGYAVRVNNEPGAVREEFHLHQNVMGGRKLGMP